jgi:TPR repeat protein
MRFLFQCDCAARLLLGCFLVGFPLLSVQAAPPAETISESPLDAGIAAVDNNDFAKAFTVFTGLAKAGNAEAQHNLAMLYRTGKGVKKDLAASFKWFRKAAEQGVSDAQYYLAYMYDNGEAVEKSPEKAFEWYLKAAEQGQGLAQINLGVIYANGFGVPQNISKAYLWFHAAAAQGYKTAFENRLVIETALKEQGDEGVKMLESLKKQARGYFQQYVQPFAPKPAPSRAGKASPLGH